MQKARKRCQAVPDRAKGIVIGVDMSKGMLDYGAFRPEEQSKVYSVEQNQEGFDQFMRSLREVTECGYEPWVAFEPTGPYSTCFREMLLTKGERVVQVNGYHVKRTKEVRDNSPKKSDLKDPGVIADLVWQGCYQEVVELPADYAELRAMIAEWVSLTKKRTALKNEFQSILEVWFPELREVFKNLTCLSIRGIVRSFASPAHIATARISSVRSALRKASLGRTVGRAEAIRSVAKRSVGVSSGVNSRRRAMLAIIDMLELIERRQSQLVLEMEESLKELPEAKCLLSMRGVGTITVAGLLGECGNIGRYKSYEHLEKFVGMNIYEVSSGKYRGRRRISKRGRALARHLICAIALSQTKVGGIFHDYGKLLRSKGKSRGHIRVTVARKLLRVLYAIARDLADFDPQRFSMGARTEDGPVIHQGTRTDKAA
jgi:transposase